MGRLEDYRPRKKQHEEKEGGMNMALTRDSRETVRAHVKRDAAFRNWLLSEAIESLLSGEVIYLIQEAINRSLESSQEVLVQRLSQCQCAGFDSAG